MTTRKSSVYQSPQQLARLRRLNYTPGSGGAVNWNNIQSELKKYFTDNKDKYPHVERCQTARVITKPSLSPPEEQKNSVPFA